MRRNDTYSKLPVKRMLLSTGGRPTLLPYMIPWLRDPYTSMHMMTLPEAAKMCGKSIFHTRTTDESFVKDVISGLHAEIFSAIFSGRT